MNQKQFDHWRTWYAYYAIRDDTRIDDTSGGSPIGLPRLKPQRGFKTKSPLLGRESRRVTGQLLLTALDIPLECSSSDLPLVLGV